MKKLVIIAALLSLPTVAVFAQDAESPFKNSVEIRHRLMLKMAFDLGKLGAIAKGETLFDSAVATKAAANISAIASVLGMDQFPAGPEGDAALDSFALPVIWANPDDFDLKVKSLNDASATMKDAVAKDGDAVKAAMATLGGACGSCHKAYRQPES